MTLDAVQVPCPHCRLSSPPPSPELAYWECPGCKRAFFLRRCRACHAVSHVGAQQSWHHRWQCVWCEHRNFGFSLLGDPVAATVADLVADIARRDLILPPGDADRQTQPIPIVAAQAASIAPAAGSAAPPASATIPLPEAPALPEAAAPAAGDPAPSAAAAYVWTRPAAPPGPARPARAGPGRAAQPGLTQPAAAESGREARTGGRAGRAAPLVARPPLDGAGRGRGDHPDGRARRGAGLARIPHAEPRAARRDRAPAGRSPSRPARCAPCTCRACRAS